MFSISNKSPCPACGALISRSHLRLHVLRDKKPECQAYLANLDADLPDSDDEGSLKAAPPAQATTSPPSRSQDGQDHRLDGEHMFGMNIDPLGDYFGGYMEEDVAQMDTEDDGGKEMTVDEDVDTEDEDGEPYDQAAADAEAEGELEVERPNAPVNTPELPAQAPSTESNGAHTNPSNSTQTRNANVSCTPTFGSSTSPHIVHYGNGAGIPISEELPSQTAYARTMPASESNLYAPFASKMEWDIAYWAKFQNNLSASAVTDLLSINGVVDKLGLSFKNSVELNSIIDKDIPLHRPAFERSSFELGGEIFEVYHRDITACIEALFSDPEFAPYLKTAPEKHYTDESCTVRLYHDMHTGDWWSGTQEELDKRKAGGTVVPIILSSDKTQLTLFRNKSAYPLYMTIGNIPKEIRRRPSSRAYVLLAYLPTSRFSHITNKAARRRCVLNVYHSCMAQILMPLKDAGRKGLNLINGYGDVYRGHPIYACFIGDYPEQIQCTCTLTGDCPKCQADRNNLDEFDPETGFDANLRPLVRLLDALKAVDQDPIGYRTVAEELRVKPVVAPFWKGLPYSNVYQSITPDVLHQLYQGVLKHLVAWVTEASGAAEIDARCRRLPPNHNVHLFLKGISTLSRVSGKEHAQIAQILLGLAIDIQLPGGVSKIPFLRTIRALLDFLYLAQYPIHSTSTLKLMTEALDVFHKNKHIFITLGIRDHFNIPKLHFASHYVSCIVLFGTTDNFNTEYTERLHIDLAKDAYHATNHKDEYTQMTRWLERKEKMARHAQYIAWRQARNTPDALRAEERGNPVAQPVCFVPGLDRRVFLKMAKDPTQAGVPLERIRSSSGYGAIHFLPALSRLIALENNPSLTQQQLDREASNIFLPVRRLPVWHSMKFQRLDALSGEMRTADIIHAYPATKDNQSRPVPARFDTVLVNEGSGGEFGLKDRCVGRVRLVFGLPKNVRLALFRNAGAVSEHFAYVEWFAPFHPSPDPHTGLYKVTKEVLEDDTCLASVIPISRIYRSVHLFPRFGTLAPSSWTSSNVLDKCSAFYLNPFTDKHLYMELQQARHEH